MFHPYTATYLICVELHQKEHSSHSVSICIIAIIRYVQWNLSNPDTIRTDYSVQVYLNSETNKCGIWNRQKCLVYRGVLNSEVS